MMEELNKNTVEAWLLDFVEGNLNAAQQAQLEAFLAKNPEYAEMLNEYEEVTLTPEPIIYKNKEHLKHESTERENAFDIKCIEYHEGLMNKAQRTKFEAEIANDKQKLHTSLLYSKAKLVPDYSIQFYNKNALKKNVITKRIILNLSYAAAASIVLTAGVFMFKHYNTLQSNTTIAFVANDSTPASSTQNKNTKAVEQNKEKNNIEAEIPAEILAKDVSATLAANTKPAESVIKNTEDNNLINSTDKEEAELANYRGISVLVPIKPDVINTGNEMVAITSITSTRVEMDVKSTLNSTLSLEKQFNGMLAKARESLETNNKLTAFEWAKRVVRNISNYTGAEMSLRRTVNANGDEEEIAFESRFFGISRSSKK